MLRLRLYNIGKSKKENQMNKNKFQAVVEAICEDRFGTLEFIVDQYLSEMDDDDYINELYERLKSKKESEVRNENNKMSKMR
jgi:hypothetical protein